MGHEISQSEFDQKVIKGDGKILVDFFASWCGPCQVMSPILDEIVEEEKDAKIYKVDVEKNPDLSNQYQILSIPTMLVFEDGKIVKQFMGVVSKEEILEILK